MLALQGSQSTSCIQSREGVSSARYREYTHCLEQRGAGYTGCTRLRATSAGGSRAKNIKELKEKATRASSQNDSTNVVPTRVEPMARGSCHQKRVSSVGDISFYSMDLYFYGF
jgi:hypothetical protein